MSTSGLKGDGTKEVSVVLLIVVCVRACVRACVRVCVCVRACVCACVRARDRRTLTSADKLPYR